MVFMKPFVRSGFQAGLLRGPAGKVRPRFVEEGPFPGETGKWVPLGAALRTEAMQLWEPWEGNATPADRSGGREEPPPEDFELQISPSVCEMSQKNPGEDTELVTSEVLMSLLSQQPDECPRGCNSISLDSRTYWEGGGTLISGSGFGVTGSWQWAELQGGALTGLCSRPGGGRGRAQQTASGPRVGAAFWPQPMGSDSGKVLV